MVRLLQGTFCLFLVLLKLYASMTEQGFQMLFCTLVDHIVLNSQGFTPFFFPDSVVYSFYGWLYVKIKWPKILVSRSCSIISSVIMYTGLPPVLAKNANGGFSFGRILDAFKISDVFLNNISKDTSNTSNRSRREEFCDCDMAISILVCSSSFLAQISNPTWSDAR